MTAAPRHPLRVVVVDDDDGMRTLLRVTIEFDDRFECVAAAGSAEQLRAALAELDAPADVIVLDQTLPDADGADLLAELRAAHPAARIALYTGWSDPEIVDRARENGADVVFTKAADPSDLFERLAEPADVTR